MILREAAVCGEDAQEVFNNVYHNFTPDNLDCERRCKKCVLEWLQARHVGDARTIPHIHLTKGKEELCRTPLWRNGPTFDRFVGNSACDLPNPFEQKYMSTDFYFTDFDPNMWEVFRRIEDKTKCWLQWHGTNFYSLSAILALNYLGVSKSEDRGH